MIQLAAVRIGSTDGSSAVAADLPESLLAPLVYPEVTADVEMIETHISWVFLTDHFAYKLKKPVRFDFLDFSTVELRRESCEREVQLNSRLAPGVYLGVAPVVETSPVDGAAAGETIDWVVKMRRLPANSALDVMARDGRLAARHIDLLARTLSTSYSNLPPVEMTPTDYRRGFERNVLANRAELSARGDELDLAQIRRVHAAQLRVLRLAPELLDERVCNGRIVEGHGDLRPEHIYFTPAVVVIDCIEFNQALRTLDVADELGFLSMECDFLGVEGVAAPIIECYCEESGDRAPRRLIDFYRSYRACVRAKVAVLRAEQVAGHARARCLESARRYLCLADRYRRGLGSPLLVVVRGLPGTGKSTVAESLAEELGAELLKTDVVRKSLFGPTAKQGGYNEGCYCPQDRRRVYDEMHRRAEDLLNGGDSVVLDGTYLAAGRRVDAGELAARTGAAFSAICCRCPDGLAKQRIASRHRPHDSDARAEFFDQQRQVDEADSPDYPFVVVDTAADEGQAVRDAWEAVQQLEPRASVEPTVGHGLLSNGSGSRD
ncbi:MAG: AAA family ATPase, partial [Pirellulaceae bacterium]|nr:AAA family ATPase [Pirellulaceae bacterium]